MKREYVDSPLYRVRGMAVPQLVWVNVKTGGSSPLSANISNRLSSEMSLATGARKYIAVSFAAALTARLLPSTLMATLLSSVQSQQGANPMNSDAVGG